MLKSQKNKWFHEPKFMVKNRRDNETNNTTKQINHLLLTTTDSCQPNALANFRDVMFLCNFWHTSVGHFDLAKRSWSSETASALQIVSIFWAETVVSSSTLVHERLDVQLLLSRSQLLQLQRHLGLMLQTLRHKYVIRPVASRGWFSRLTSRFCEAKFYGWLFSRLVSSFTRPISSFFRRGECKACGVRHTHAHADTHVHRPSYFIY